MSKRQKLVFRDSTETAHVWASQSQTEGRSGGRSNVYFSGDTIYSYGPHFPMARMVTRKGQTVVLITTATYSVTTAGHLNDVRSAVRHLTSFNVPLLGDNRDDLKPGEQFATYKPRMVEAMIKATRAVKYRDAYLKDAANIVAEADRFAEFFGLKSRLEMPTPEKAVELGKAMSDAEKRREAARVKREAAERERHNREYEKRQREYEEQERVNKEKALANVVNWQLHLPVEKGVSLRHYLDDAALRVTSDGKSIETTLGAVVPIAHAHRAYKILKRLRDRHETYHRNGTTIHVGHYGVDSMDELGHLVIGCHNVQWSEVERLAAQLQWDTTEPAAEPEMAVA